MNRTVSTKELEKAVESLQRALEFLDTFVEGSLEYEITRDGCIRRFEFCIELIWKVAMRILGSVTKFPKPAVREMGRAAIIDEVELWIDFVNARNETSHTYNEETAKRVLKHVRLFASVVEPVLAKLKSIN